MSTETQSQSPPEVKIISRVTAIPLVACGLGTVHSTLTNNAYTRLPYAYAEELSKTALSYTEPLQKRLAPLITTADGYAIKGLDAIESRYPYPFKTSPEDMVKDIKGSRDHAYDVANKTIDDRVKSPAINVAQGIDQKLAPVVDYFAVAVERVQSATGSPTEGSVLNGEPPKYQYQRVFVLSKELGDQLYSYSAEQINQIKAQNALVQRATEAAQNINAIASTGYGAAQEKVHGMSDVMLQELQRVQASTANLPTAVQNAFNDISTPLSATIHDLSAILTSSDPMNEKVQKVRVTVQDRVQPILEASAVRVQQMLDLLMGKAAEKADQAQDAAPRVNGSVNGRAE